MPGKLLKVVMGTTNKRPPKRQLNKPLCACLDQCKKRDIAFRGTLILEDGSKGSLSKRKV